MVSGLAKITVASEKSCYSLKKILFVMFKFYSVLIITEFNRGNDQHTVFFMV